MTKHANIPDDLMDRYLRHELTSRQLGELTGYNPVYLRRTIKREPKPTSSKTKHKIQEAKRKIRLARAELAKRIAHQPEEKIMKALSVSRSTASRIRKKYQ